MPLRSSKLYRNIIVYNFAVIWDEQGCSFVFSCGGLSPHNLGQKVLKSFTWARKCVKSEEKSLNWRIMMALWAVFTGSAPTTHFANLRPWRRGLYKDPLTTWEQWEQSSLTGKSVDRWTRPRYMYTYPKNQVPVSSNSPSCIFEFGCA